MRALLDVNVLIALFDQDHVFHDRAHQWLEKNTAYGIATCPLTENGVVRVISHPKYSNTLRLSPGEVVARLDTFCNAQNHVFWPDSVSLREPELFLAANILGTRQVTDAYLLGLATKNGGRLVTFDEGITLKSIHGAKAENLTII